MELVEEKSCLLCSENDSIISLDGSKNYFNLLNKDNYCYNSLVANKFQKVFESKHICITCAYKVDKVYNLIQHIVNNNDSYFNKHHSKNKCSWCHIVNGNLLAYNTFTDKLKEITDEFVKSVTKKEFDFEGWWICINCNFCLISWDSIKTSLDSIMGNPLDSKLPPRRTKSLDTSKKPTSQVKSKMPKIKLKLPHAKPKSKMTKTRAVKRKIEIDDLGNKLKHLKSVTEQMSEEFLLSSKCMDDKKMLMDIPYVQIDLEDIEQKCQRINDRGGDSSESEMEYVEASTSSAPTKPPVRRKKSWNNQHFSENEVSNEESTPMKKNKRVSFADSIEIKNLSPESEEDTSTKKQNKKSASKRNLRLRKSDISEEATPKKKLRKKSQKSVANDTEQIKYNCSICKEEFSARCYQKLHEFEHNMNFSPVILLDTTAIDNMHEKTKINGLIESESNDADDEGTAPGRLKKSKYNRRRSTRKDKNSDGNKSSSDDNEPSEFNNAEDENKMEQMVQIDEIINSIDKIEDDDKNEENGVEKYKNGTVDDNIEDTELKIENMEDNYEGDEQKYEADVSNENKIDPNEDKDESSENDAGNRATLEGNNDRDDDRSVVSNEDSNELIEKQKTDEYKQTDGENRSGDETKEENCKLNGKSRRTKRSKSRDSIFDSCAPKKSQVSIEKNNELPSMENNKTELNKTKDIDESTDLVDESSEKVTETEDEVKKEVDSSQGSSNKENEDSDKENKDNRQISNENEEEDNEIAESKHLVTSVEASINDTDSEKSVCGSEEDSASKNLLDVNEIDEDITINEDLDDTIKSNDRSSPLLEEVSDGDLDINDCLIEGSADEMVSVIKHGETVNGSTNKKIDDILNIDDVRPEPSVSQPSSQSDLDNIGDIDDSDSIHLCLSSDFFSSNTTDTNEAASENSEKFKEVESLLEGLGA